jgi:hypothetical protein
MKLTTGISNCSSLDKTYDAVLHTNFVPSDEECRRIRDLVVAPVDELEETKKELTRLKSEFDKLARRRDESTEYIDLHLALMSPARRLPEDIVREIFTASLPSDRHPRMSCESSPLLLCGICHDWRRLALSMPRLWASLHIELIANSRFSRSKGVHAAF